MEKDASTSYSNFLARSGGHSESCLVFRTDLQVWKGLVGSARKKSVTQLAHGKRNGVGCAAGSNKVELHQFL